MSEGGAETTHQKVDEGNDISSEMERAIGQESSSINRASPGNPEGKFSLDDGGEVYVSYGELQFIVDEARMQPSQVSNQTSSIMQRIGIALAFSSILMIEALRRVQAHALSWIPVILLLASAFVGFIAIRRDCKSDFPLGIQLRQAIVRIPDGEFSFEGHVGKSLLDALDKAQLSAAIFGGTLWRKSRFFCLGRSALLCLR